MKVTRRRPQSKKSTESMRSNRLSDQRRTMGETRIGRERFNRSTARNLSQRGVYESR